MQIIECDAAYFNPRDVLECGQIFRFIPFKEGYKVFSADKACYVHTQKDRTLIECEDGDYFYNFLIWGGTMPQSLKKQRVLAYLCLRAAQRLARG